MWQSRHWTIENPSWSADPFDVIATVTFRHSPTDKQHTTEMFYAGDNRWQFRFTGTRAGRWNFTTVSDDPDLHGHSGTITVTPRTDPNIKGFLTGAGNKYAVMERDADHLSGYVYQVFMNQQDFEQQHDHKSRILAAPDRIPLIADYWNNTRENGFDIYFFAVFYSWFRMGALSIDDFAGRSDPDLQDPDPALFDTLERAIRYAHQRGGRTHIWAWGDNGRKQTPNHLAGGFRGKVHRRLIRYIAARLGPLPGWTMNFGFDTIEMPGAEADSAWWADRMNETMGWPHILTSRGWKNDSFGADSYAGFGGNPYDLQTTDKGPADYDEIRRHMAADTTKPSIYEERHTYNRWKCWPTRVPDPARLDETNSRRLIWWQAMAGGMGGFFGHFSTRFNAYGPFRPDGPCGYYPESLKQAFRTHRRFWQSGRLRLDMSPADNRVSGPTGYCLASADKRHFIFFLQDANAATIDLTDMPCRGRLIAVNANAPWREIDKGTLAAGIHHIHLNATSDWALAIDDCTPADHEPATDRDPTVSRVKRRIESAVSQLDPNLMLSFEYSAHSNTLLVKYKTRKFMVHGHSKIGQHSEQARQREGPNYRGVLLRIHLQKSGTVNQAMVPQTITEPYWQTDLNITLIDNHDKQLYWALSYGPRTDRKLIRALTEAVHSVGRPYAETIPSDTATTPQR